MYTSQDDVNIQLLVIFTMLGISLKVCYMFLLNCKCINIAVFASLATPEAEMTENLPHTIAVVFSCLFSWQNTMENSMKNIKVLVVEYI